jgi:hypothetical protein
MTTDITTPPRKNFGLLYGFINAGASIIWTVILYLGGLALFMSPLSYLGFIIPIVICVLGGLQQKKFQGGYLEFSEALKTTFMILVVGAFFATLFNFVLLNYIDVPFRQAMMQEAAAKAERMMEKFGMPQDQIDKAVEDMLNGNNYTLGKQFLGFAFWCIGLFVVALIVSAIIKKKRPPFENTFNQ